MLEKEVEMCRLLHERRLQFENNERKILKNISPQIIKRISYIIEKINSKLKEFKIDSWGFSITDSRGFETRPVNWDTIKNQWQENKKIEFKDKELDFHYSTLLNGESVIINISLVEIGTNLVAIHKCEFKSYVFFKDSVRVWNFIEYGHLTSRLSIPLDYFTDNDFDDNFEKGYIMYQLEKN